MTDRPTSSRSEATARIAAGLSADPGAIRRARRRAATFAPDERHEAVLRLQADDPAAYARLASITRSGAAHYAQAKAAIQAAAEPDRAAAEPDIETLRKRAVSAAAVEREVRGGGTGDDADPPAA